MAQIIGREEEIAVLSRCLEKVMGRKGHTSLISGEAGLGKSTMVDYLKAEAENRGMLVCTGETTLQDQSVPYVSFKRALDGLIDEDLFQSEEFTHFDELFLISKAGLLISHVSHTKEGGMDEDILGSMLTAVQDFVKDSFGDGGTESGKGGLGKLEYMDTKIFIEHGELVYLAAVTSGEEHSGMKQVIRNCLSEIESGYYDVLAVWDGDVDSLSGTADMLRQVVGTPFRVKRSLESINLETERLKTQNRILDSIIRESESRGVLLILEDIHWADMSTLLTLPFLARNIVNSRILMCLTYRPGSMEAQFIQQINIVGGLSSDAENSTIIPLKPLDDASLCEIASSMLDGDMPPDELLCNIRNEADGNPFFVIEAVRALVSDGTLFRDGDVWVLKHGPRAKIPHSITELVSRRLESLDLDSLRFVEYGAVLGRRFGISMLQSGFSLEQDKAGMVIDSLIENNILVRLQDDDLMFLHSKTQEVIYSGLSNRWKKALHRNAGTVIESRSKERPDTALFSLAYHFSNALDFDKGVDYCISAGYKASNNLAPVESIQFFEQAVKLLRMSGKTDDRYPDLLERLGEQHELNGNYAEALANYASALDQSPGMPAPPRIAMEMGRVHQAQGNYDEAIYSFERGISLAHDGGFGFWKSKINGYMGKIYLRKGLYDKALELQSDYLAESLSQGDSREIGQAYMNIGGVYHHMKDYDRAISNWKKSLAYFEKARYMQGIAFVNDNLGVAHLWLGQFEQASGFYEKSEELMNKIGDVKGLSMVLNNLGVLHDDMGDYQGSLRLYHKSLQIKKKIGDAVGVANIHNNIGSAYFNMGRYHEALDNHRENHAIMLETEDTWGIAQSLNNMAEAEIELGRIEDAKAHCQESMELAERHSFKEILADVNRLMGIIVANNSEIEDSDKHFDRGLQLAKEIEEPVTIGMLYLTRARVRKKQGNASGSRESYSMALETFEVAGVKNMAEIVRREMAESE